MARKSRISKEQNFIEEYKNEVYEAGVYRRLSVEADGDDEKYHSIGNQTKIAEDYVSNTPFLHIKREYTDNGISGMTFNRPGFIEMMNDLQAGIINCIIVKDVSRLGRHFIMTSELVEKTLPSMGVRLICINDNYDSINPASDTEALLMGIKMVLNDNYAKDYSKKIRSSINAKMDAGEYLPSSSSIPYGYIRNAKEKTFDIDQDTAPVVKRIFELRMAGESFSAIAKKLNEEGYSSPGKLRYERGLTKSEKYKDSVWLRGAVRKISSDPVYTGSRIHGKVKRDCLGEAKTRREQDEWQVIENAHEAIISKELFDSVQEVNEKALADRKSYQRRPEIEDDQRELLKDKIECGDCGSKMSGRKGISRSRKTGEYSSFVYFDCNRYQDTVKMQCKSHYVRQEDIMRALTKCLATQVKAAFDYETYIEQVKSLPKVVKHNKESATSEASLRAKLINLEAKKMNLLEDLSEGVISNKEFVFMKDRLDIQINQFQKKLTTLKQESKTLDVIHKSSEAWISEIKRFIETEKIDRRLLDALVDKIVIYDKNHIEIRLAFSDPFKAIQNYVDTLEEVLEHAG